jgi:hypothetical protein
MNTRNGATVALGIELSEGNTHNVAVSAAFLAADADFREYYTVVQALE